MMLTTKFYKCICHAFLPDIKSGLRMKHCVTVLMTIHDRYWVNMRVCRGKLDLARASLPELRHAATLCGVLGRRR